MPTLPLAIFALNASALDILHRLMHALPLTDGVPLEDPKIRECARRTATDILKLLLRNLPKLADSTDAPNQMVAQTTDAVDDSPLIEPDIALADSPSAEPAAQLRQSESSEVPIVSDPPRVADAPMVAQSDTLSHTPADAPALSPPNPSLDGAAPDSRAKPRARPDTVYAHIPHRHR